MRRCDVVLSGFCPLPDTYSNQRVDEFRVACGGGGAETAQDLDWALGLTSRGYESRDSIAPARQRRLSPQRSGPDVHLPTRPSWVSVESNSYPNDMIST